MCQICLPQLTAKKFVTHFGLSPSSKSLVLGLFIISDASHIHLCELPLDRQAFTPIYENRISEKENSSEAMKHLPRPASVASQEAETVAYVCQTESDDGKPYELPPASDTRENLPFWQYERHHPSPKQELESFFQTWLFFGLINEIHGDLYSANDFVRAAADDTSQVVTISQLLGIIDIWIQNVHSGDLRPSYDNVAEGLRLTHESLRATGLTSDLTLMLSIAATGELLEYAANKAFHIGNFVEDYKCPSSWRILFNESLWEASMREAGWCPSQITLLFQGCFSVQSLYFFIWLS